MITALLVTYLSMGLAFTAVLYAALMGHIDLGDPEIRLVQDSVTAALNDIRGVVAVTGVVCAMALVVVPLWPLVIAIAAYRANKEKTE